MGTRKKPQLHNALKKYKRKKKKGKEKKILAVTVLISHLKHYQERNISDN